MPKTLTRPTPSLLPYWQPALLSSLRLHTFGPATSTPGTPGATCKPNGDTAWSALPGWTMQACVPIWTSWATSETSAEHFLVGYALQSVQPLKPGQKSASVKNKTTQTAEVTEWLM